ncbi:MAG: hypothetical protein HC888_07335 [Candidatus Competibacteraceae bacterium]|nr:hypothetical protein [Candidatus Competibacteraceae bacterium]
MTESQIIGTTGLVTLHIAQSLAETAFRQRVFFTKHTPVAFFQSVPPADAGAMRLPALQKQSQALLKTRAVFDRGRI